VESKPFIICAQQRSGTTAFQLYLEAAGFGTNFGEVFHQDNSHITEEWVNISYHHFKANYIKENPTRVIPSKANQIELLEAYLLHLSTLSDKERFLIDIKYNSWHHFDSTWRDPISRPLLLNYCMSNALPIVQKTNILHLKREKSRPSQKIQIKIDEYNLVERIGHLMALDRQYHQWLDRYSNKMNLYYSDIFTKQGNINLNTIKLIESFTDAKIPRTICPVKKSILSYKNIILNISEIKDRLYNTEYYWMLQELNNDL